jgi:ribosomal protein L21E
MSQSLETITENESALEVGDLVTIRTQPKFPGSEAFKKYNGRSGPIESITELTTHTHYAVRLSDGLLVMGLHEEELK